MAVVVVVMVVIVVVAVAAECWWRRRLDIGAASAIHRQLIALRDSGTAILVVSEDIDELFILCDRLAAIYEGQVSEAVKTTDTSIDQIGEWIAGGFISQAEVANA